MGQLALDVYVDGAEEVDVLAVRPARCGPTPRPRRARPAGTVPELPGIDTDAARTLLARLRDPDDPPRALTDAELSGLLAR